MRAFVLLAALLVTTGALAGCVNTAKDPIQQGSVDGATTEPGNDNAGSKTPPVVKILAPLTLSISSAAPEWVAPGTMIPVDAPTPANAKGAVTYTWAIGALPGTVAVDGKYDTGSSSAKNYIQSGEKASITFDKAGTFLMHCHPHPWMLQNVTVVEGVTSPSTVNVQIVDGDKPDTYRFVPENILIAPGTKVTYHNNGTMPHTATLMTAGPALKMLPLTAATGEIAAEGDGWQRVLVFAKDAEGRAGVTEKRVYVKALPTFAQKKIPISYNVAADGAPETVVPPITSSFALEFPGQIFLNYTVKDAPSANGAPANAALVDVHVKQQGETQDTITSTGKAADAQTARGPAGTYQIQIVPKAGVAVTGEAVIEVVYDAVPPEPTMAGGGDHGDHGGHAH